MFIVERTGDENTYKGIYDINGNKVIDPYNDENKYTEIQDIKNGKVSIVKHRQKKN